MDCFFEAFFGKIIHHQKLQITKSGEIIEKTSTSPFITINPH
jgi:hypothetical protein